MIAANNSNGRDDKPQATAFQGDGGFVSPQAEFDAMIGRQVASEVSKRAPGQRRPAPAEKIKPEPEEVGEKGSRLYRCIVTGEVHPREAMVRFVVGPENEIVPDLDENLPGRGYWVKADHKTLGRAVAEGAFPKAIGREITVSPALSSLVVDLARQACLNLFGLARRAWAVDMGYEHVRAALLGRKLGLVFIASNSPLEFRHKLADLTRQTPVLTLFTTAQLSAALGQERLAFVGVQKGQWSARLIAYCTRLAELIAPATP